MTTESEALAEQIARVMELDAKRTHGVWLPVQDTRHRMAWNWFVGVENTSNEICSMFHDGEEDGGCAGRNAAFIASAPIMASIIRQLVDIVTQQHEAGKAFGVSALAGAAFGTYIALECRHDT